MLEQSVTLAHGRQASPLGLGGFHQVEISSEIVAAVVDRFLALGGNYIETARAYGQGASEAKIGQALRGRRDQVVLTSKSPRRDADGIRRDLEASLQALQTDHLDYYFLHNVASEEDLAAVQGDDGALTALLKARDEGLIAGIGLSSHRPAMYLRALRELPLAIILVWDNYLEAQYLPIIREEIFPLARERGVIISAMKPLADGFLWRSARNAFRYVAGGGADIIVSGMNAVAHVEAAVQALAAGPADSAACEDILRDAPELGPYVCRQCPGCSDALRQIFRWEGMCDRQMVDYLEHDPADYALRLRLSGWFNMGAEARAAYAASTQDHAAQDAEAQTVHCPYGIDVPRKLALARAKLSGEKTDLL